MNFLWSKKRIRVCKTRSAPARKRAANGMGIAKPVLPTTRSTNATRLFANARPEKTGKKSSNTAFTVCTPCWAGFSLWCIEGGKESLLRDLRKIPLHVLHIRKSFGLPILERPKLIQLNIGIMLFLSVILLVF